MAIEEIGCVAGHIASERRLEKHSDSARHNASTMLYSFVQENLRCWTFACLQWQVARTKAHLQEVHIEVTDRFQEI